MEEMLTIEEMKRKYPSEWVCMEVVEEDRNGEPKSGRVIVHSHEKSMAVEAATAFRKQSPHSRGSLFFTGEL